MQKTFSYDVFDTAITRQLAHHSHIHWVTELKIRELGLNLPADMPWANIRIRSEAEVRQFHENGEVTLDEIYDYISNKYNLDRSVARSLMCIELDSELFFVSKIREVFDKYITDRVKGRQVFLSDMYLSSDFIRKMTMRAGYETAEVITSGETRKSKSKGDIYPLLFEILNTEPDMIEHIGDNRRSDFTNARRFGIRTHLFKDGILNKREKCLFELGGSNLTSSIIAGSARAARLSRSNANARHKTLWRISTNVSGPVLFGFVLWVVLNASKRSIRDLYFLARDGQILAKIAEMIVNWLRLDLNCHYTMASRQALHLPSLPDSSTALIAKIKAVVRNQKLKSLLEQLGCSENEITAASKESGYNSDQEPTTEFWEWFAGSRLLNDTIIDRIRDQKSKLKNYADSIGLTNSGFGALVDLGWRGNLQLMLEKSLGPGATPKFGYYFSLFETPAGLFGEALKYTEPQKINADILESFCLATHETIRSYDFTADDSLLNLLETPPTDGPTHWSVTDQQDGILAFAQYFTEKAIFINADPHAVLASIKPASLAALESFRRHPAPDEAEAFGSVQHASDQMHTHLAEIAPKLAPNKLVKFILKQDEKRLGRWRHGSVYRSIPNWLWQFGQWLDNTWQRIALRPKKVGGSDQ